MVSKITTSKVPAKRTLLACIGILALGALAIALHYYVLAGSYRARVNAYKRAYAKELTGLVEGSASPDATSDIHAYISSRVLNDALKTFVGVPFAVSRRANLTLSDIAFTSEGGTPLLKIRARLFFKPGDRNSIDVDGTATISPLSAHDGSFYTHLQIVSLRPTFMTAGLRLALHGFFGDLASAIAQEQLDAMPGLELPIAQTLTFPVKGSKEPLHIKTRPPNSDTLHGVLTSNDFQLQCVLTLKQALFLKDGLHVFLSLDDRKSPRLEDPDWQRLSNEQRLATLMGTTSYFARINRDAINYLVTSILTLPAKANVVTFNSTGLDGNLYYWDNVHRGPFHTFLWREEFKVYLDRPDAVTSTVAVKSLTTNPKDGALIGIDLTAGVTGHLQLAWHYNNSPVGGGVGSPHNRGVGFSLSPQTEVIKASLHVVDGAPAQLQGTLDGPQSIQIQLLAGLGGFNVPFNVNVPLPIDKALFSLPIPTGLKEEISFKVNDTGIRRVVESRDLRLETTTYGILINGQIFLSPVQSKRD
jgi:hypothetical protein